MNNNNQNCPISDLLTGYDKKNGSGAKNIQDQDSLDFQGSYAAIPKRLSINLISELLTS